MEIIHITSLEQAEQAMAEPLSVIFKHSTHCPTSARIKRMFDAFANMYSGEAKLYQVNIIDTRAISDEIEKRTGIRHESPQMIVFVDGAPVWHASHGAITDTALKEHLGEK